jgi:hypothetical protein
MKYINAYGKVIESNPRWPENQKHPSGFFDSEKAFWQPFQRGWAVWINWKVERIGWVIHKSITKLGNI